MSTDAEKLVLLERLDRAIEAKNKYVQKGKEEAQIYLQGAETAFTAGAIGYYEGRTGKQNLFDGLPLDFLVGAGAYAFGFFGMKGKQASHAYAVGNGGFAVYTYKWGRDMGQRMSAPAPQGTATPTATSGALPPGGLSDTELSRLVQAARQL